LVDEVGAGPGLLPFMGGSILSILGLTVLLSTIRTSWKDKKDLPETERFFPEPDSFRKIFLTIIGLCLYVFAFEYLGFLLTNFFVLVFLMRFVEPNKWVMVWVVALLTAGSFQLVFRIILKVPFPKGIFGI
jgi:hypothetical protein